MVRKRKYIVHIFKVSISPWTLLDSTGSLIWGDSLSTYFLSTYMASTVRGIRQTLSPPKKTDIRRNKYVNCIDF